MPELPEVETIARQLDGVLPGRMISSIEVLRDKSFSGKADEVVGKEIKRVWRKAKNIIIEMQGAGNKEQVARMLIHLKMTGQLIFDENEQEPTNNDQTNTKMRVVGGHPTPDWIDELPSKHTRVVISFEDGSTLYFNDMRVFGWIKIVDSQQWAVNSAAMPPDIVDEEFTVDYLKEALSRSRRAIKLVLLDQAKMGGLGNIYVNDALHLAQAKPTRSANEFKKNEIREIHEACVKVIKRGIETGGASDSTYKHIDGLGGSYQDEFIVYKREGEECWHDDCGGTIEKIKLGGRGTYYCSVCQV